MIEVLLGYFVGREKTDQKAQYCSCRYPDVKSGQIVKEDDEILTYEY